MGRISYNVVKPPTSGEVENRALAALGERGVLKLGVLASEQQVPPAKEEYLSFRIRQTDHPREGGMVISGYTEDRQFVTVQTSQDTGQTAVAYIINGD